MSCDGLAGSAWLLTMFEINRALGSCGRDGELIPLAYCAGVSRSKSVPAWPQVGLARLFPDPLKDSTLEAAGALAGAAVPDNRTRGSSTSAACWLKSLGLRRRARPRFRFRLRFIVGSPFEIGPAGCRGVARRNCHGGAASFKARTLAVAACRGFKKNQMAQEFCRRRGLRLPPAR